MDTLSYLALRLAGAIGMIVLGLFLMLASVFFKLFIFVCLLALIVWIVIRIIQSHKHKVHH